VPDGLPAVESVLSTKRMLPIGAGGLSVFQIVISSESLTGGVTLVTFTAKGGAGK